MTDHRNISTDEGLKDNERMEQAILSLQQNPIIPNIHPILPYTFIRNWGIFSYFNNFPIVL